MDNSKTNYPDSAPWELLTQACFSEQKPEIEQCAQAWGKSSDPNDIDFRSMRLIPYFVDHLKKHGVPIPHAKRLSIVYKYWWLKSEWILHELEQITELFAKHDIPLIVLKGAALYPFYDKPVHRTMVDLDLLIPRDKAKQAYRLLSSEGFRGDDHHFKLFCFSSTLFKTNNHAFYLIHKKSGLQIDLHWSTYHMYDQYLTETIWREARPDVKNAKRLLPPLHLLYLINGVNGYMSEATHSNWVLDARIMRSRFSSEDKHRLDNYLKKRNIPALTRSEECVDYYMNERATRPDMAADSVSFDWKSAPSLGRKISGFFRAHREYASIIRMFNGGLTSAGYIWWLLRTYAIKLISKTVIPEPKEKRHEWQEHTDI